MHTMKKARIALTVFALMASACAIAQETLIRKNLSERIPQLQKIEEVKKSAMPGLFEVRVNGADIFYTDAAGNFLIKGNLIDTKHHRNLTEERVEKLTAIGFDALPLVDSFTIVRGNGKRKMAVFGDPNCGYCKRFEKDLQKIDNVTIHMFLYPILSADSNDKSRNIWCSKDKGAVWQDWMVHDQLPKAATCDTAALDRNLEFGRMHQISGTPTLVFADSTRVPGAINTDQIEKHLTAVKN